MKLIGVMLIVLGVIALAIGGITYTKHDKILDLGPLQASADHDKTLRIPPVAGVLAIAGGAIILVAGGSRTRA